MAVVKADAYGHGATEVAKAACEGGASWLGVAHIDEGLELRKNGITAPILAWLHTTRSGFREAVDAGIDLGISGWELPALLEAAGSLRKPARVHFKVDTGLGRNGAGKESWAEVLTQLVESEGRGKVEIVGLFSHLAVADEPERSETARQLSEFKAAANQAADLGAHIALHHLANTAAALAHPETRLDMVRVGLGIYGLSPFATRSPEDLGLRPAMTLCTFVSNCRHVKAGQNVSYGLTYKTARASTLALIPVGYGDGIPRTAEGARVFIEGRTYPVVGRVAMDQIVVDLGSVVENPAKLIGAEAIVFGPGRRGEPTAYDWAVASNTNNYEIVTRISPRVRRQYVSD